MDTEDVVLSPPDFPGFQNGGKHEGEYPVAVWNIETAHHSSIRNTIDFLNRLNRMSHFVWIPWVADPVQCLPLDVAGRQYSKEINRGGAPCIQITVCLPSGGSRMTDYPCEGLGGLLETLRGLGVPDAFPLGPPSPYAASWGLLRAFPAPGHYAGNQVDPGLDGMGRVNVRRFFQPIPVEENEDYE